MGNKKSKEGFYSDAYWQSADWNQRKTLAYLTQLEALAMNRFRWEGLPPTVDTRYLEYCLLHYGVATIAFPEDYPEIWVCGKAAFGGTINRYHNPTRWYLYGAAGDAFPVTPLNGVLIWNSQTRNNPWNQLDMWARELADIDRTRDVNRAHIKSPVIFSGPRGKKQDLENIVNAWLGGEPAIMLYENMAANGIEVSSLKVEVPFYGAELFADAMNVLNRAYTFLGIENLPTKAERMIQEEIQSTMEPTSVNALDGLDSRRVGARELHYFGLKEAYCRWHLGKYDELPNYGGGVNGLSEAAV